MATSTIRWDWIVVIVGTLACCLVGFALGPFGIGLAVGGGYGLGRWDSTYGTKWRGQQGMSPESD